MRGVLLSLTMAAFLVAGSATGSAQVPEREQDPKVVAAAPGRIEGSAEPIELGASISGLVEAVPVRQGDAVAEGQLLVRIDCDDIAAKLDQRMAEYEASVAVHSKAVNGSRALEVEIAKAEVGVAEARLAEARARLARTRTLVESDNASRSAYETAERDSGMASAQLAAVQSRLRLLEAGTRGEEIAEARARMLAMKHAVEIARVELAKCEIRSPIDGIVLRKHVSEGELVSLAYPKPLLTVAELHHYRVRAEVDEHDVPLISGGGEVEIVINGATTRRLRGHVASLAPVMGRRRTLTTDPADKSDRDIMEVLIDIEGRPENVPIGLRVTVLFLE